MLIDAPLDSLTVAAGWRRLEPGLVRSFEGVATAVVGDVFDRLLVVDGGIAPVTSRACFVGSALTVLTRAGDNLAIHKAVDDALPGDVMVINGQGDTSRALVGDLLGEAMVAKGICAVVVDGAVRDRVALSELGIPVFARAVTPAGPFKNGPGTIGFPVAAGGVVVHPGDIVVGDHDGVAVVPADRAAWAVERVKAVLAFEESIRQRIKTLAP